MQHPHEEIELQMAQAIDYLSAVVNAQTLADYGRLHREMLAALNARMEKEYARLQDAPADAVFADAATVIVEDASDHRLYARTLPLDYKENSNGVSIQGENLRGEAQNIVFLSGTAVDKIKELMGQGWEKPRCNHED